MPSSNPPAGNSVIADLLKDQQAMLSKKKTWQETWAASQTRAFENQGKYNNAPHQDHQAADSPMAKHLKAGVGPTKSSPRR